MLQTIEKKMDSILQESERRTKERLERIEAITTEKFEHLGGRVAQLENRDINQEVLENHITAFSSTMNQQMDEITNRLDTNLVLIIENAGKIAVSPTINTVCPNEGRMTKVEGDCVQNGQDHRNFSLILTGMGPEHQNLNGILGFSRDMLGVFIDPNEVADAIRLGVKRQGRTVIKVVFYSVGTRLSLYQAHTGLRGRNHGIFMNEDLTKDRERLCYMTRLLYNGKSVAKNWNFRGRIYIKKILEGEVVEIMKKSDLVQ